MNNRLPLLTYIYNRYACKSPNKKAAVYLRITHNYKQKFISTGIMLYPNQWKRDTVVNTPNAFQLNQQLNKLMGDVSQIILEMSNSGYIDLDAIPTRLKELCGERMSFIDYCNQRAEIRKYGKESDTKERYDRFLRLFTQWGGIHDFDDINEKSLISYDKYLSDKGMKPYSKWQNYHRFLNSFILDAIDEGYLRKNPYKWVNIEKGKDSHCIDKCLTYQEFLHLKNAIMPTESLSRVRDLFIFQTYTCLRYSDLRAFDAGNIIKVNGINVYKCIQKKTRKVAIIPLLQTPMDILKKYEYRLPIISNVKYNLYLKAVAQAANLDYSLSTHWARHTGATILLNEGVDMKIVARICGHSSTRITEQVYAKLLDETVVDAITKLDI